MRDDTIYELLDGLEFFLEGYIDEPTEYDADDFSYWLMRVRKWKQSTTG
jgi:hypothetical protein